MRTPTNGQQPRNEAYPDAIRQAFYSTHRGKTFQEHDASGSPEPEYSDEDEQSSPHTPPQQDTPRGKEKQAQLNQHREESSFLKRRQQKTSPTRESLEKLVKLLIIKENTNTKIAQSRAVERRTDRIDKRGEDVIKNTRSTSTDPILIIIWLHQAHIGQRLLLALQDCMIQQKSAFRTHLPTDLWTCGESGESKYMSEDDLFLVVFNALTRFAASHSSIENATESDQDGAVAMWLSHQVADMVVNGGPYIACKTIMETEDTARKIQKAVEWVFTDIFQNMRGLMPRQNVHNNAFLAHCVRNGWIDEKTYRDIASSQRKQPLETIIEHVRSLLLLDAPGAKLKEIKTRTIPGNVFGATEQKTPEGTPKCFDFIRGGTSENGCTRGSKCKFIHDPNATITQRHHGSAKCRHYKVGLCNRGDDCVFYHDPNIVVKSPTKAREERKDRTTERTTERNSERTPRKRSRSPPKEERARTKRSRSHDRSREDRKKPLNRL